MAGEDRNPVNRMLARLLPTRPVHGVGQADPSSQPGVSIAQPGLSVRANTGGRERERLRIPRPFTRRPSDRQVAASTSGTNHETSSPAQSEPSHPGTPIAGSATTVVDQGALETHHETRGLASQAKDTPIADSATTVVDQGALETHHETRELASQAKGPEPLPAERTSSENSPHALPTPELEESLWDDVYGTLRVHVGGLLPSYEAILSQNLQGASPELTTPDYPSPGAYVNRISQDSTQTRRAQMKELVDLWLEEKQRGVSTDEDAGVGKLRTLLRDIIGESIHSTPPDSVLVWVAACYATEKVLLHPTEASEDDSTGLLYVVSRIEWYCRLSHLLHPDDTAHNAINDEYDETDLPSLRRTVTTLYRAVLSYLMTMVCLHLGTLDLGLQSNAIGPGASSCLERLKTVKAAESALPLFNKVRVQVRLEGVLKAAKESLEAKAPPSQPGEDTQHEQLLRKLKIPDPRLSVPKLQMGAHRDPTHELYHALLETRQYKEFHNWSRHDDTRRLLCVSGGPGQGKTMLLTGVVQTQLAGKAHTKGYDARQLSFFFFDSSRPNTNHPAAALRGLLWLLLDAQPELEHHLRSQFDSTGRDDFCHPCDFFALSAVFYRIIQDDALKDTYLVVDAVDECSPDSASTERPGISDFLRLIAKSMSMSNKIRWLVSIDDVGLLKPALVGEGTGHSCLHLDLRSDLRDSVQSRRAVTMYIDSRVADLASAKKYDSALREEVAEKLGMLSDQNYLWVTILCSALRAEEVWYVLDVLRDVEERRKVPELYGYMYGQIRELPRRDGDYCIRVMSVMACATRPLRTDEIGALAELDDRVDLRSMLRKCSAFVREADDGAVCFLHPSAQKFIQDTLDGAMVSETHSVLARNCLDQLGATLTNDVEAKAPKATVSYSALNWIAHLSPIEALRKKVHWFLKNHFLEWVEHLTLHNLLPAAAAMLQTLNLRLQRSALPTTTDISTTTLHGEIRDVLLFIHLHISIRSPEGAPASNTLLLCPETSHIRNLWMGKANPWLLSAPPMNRLWQVQGRTLTGHDDWVRSTSFSADGRLFASGSDDSTVRIWDIERGVTQHVLEVDRGWIYCVAFSVPQGLARRRLVAAGSDDGSVTIWDLDTAQHLRTLSHPSAGINSLAFSTDARRLAVASEASVRVWDIQELGNTEFKEGGTAPEYRDIQHGDSVRSVALSPDGRLIATGADDAKVRLWGFRDDAWIDVGPSEESRVYVGKEKNKDTRESEPLQGVQTDKQANTSDGADIDSTEHVRAAKGAEEPGISPLHILEGHEGPINSVSFSSDSKLLASGSDDGSSRVWQFGPGKPEVLCTLKPSLQPLAINSVIFFKDREVSYLAFSTNDSICISDLRTGQKVRTITSRSLGRILSLSCTPNGAYFATGHYTGSVGLWNSTPWEIDEYDISDEQPQSASAVERMTLSPDGRTLATCDGNQVSLWDVSTGELINRALGDFQHKGTILTMVFSPRDGTMLLIGITDGTVGAYKVPSGVRLNSFSGHTDFVRGVAWSPDNKHAASCSDDGTVRIWKIGGDDRQEEHITLRHSDDDSYVMGVAFSPNGKYLVSCGRDGKLQIWEQTNAEGSDNLGWQVKHILQGNGDGVVQVTVSLDSKRVVSLDMADELKVWDIETGTQSDKYPATEFKGTDIWLRIWFDAQSDDHIVSAYGAQSLTAGSASSAFAPAPPWCPYRIAFVDKEGWHVTRGGKKLMFFPTVVGIRRLLLADHRVVLGMVDGRVLVYRFREDVVTRGDYDHVIVRRNSTALSSSG